jgi:lysophospholipase L1-like esterase
MLRALALFVGALLLTGCAHKTPITSGDITFLGDSITAGYGLDPGEAYPSLIAIPGMSTVNLGVSGSTSADGLQRLRDYFTGGATPRLVVIALGANDILHNDPAGQTEANLNAAVAECQSHGAAVLLCGVKIPFKLDTASIFEHVASRNHVPLVPDILMGEAFQPDFLQEDHMHPTADGQKVIAGKLQAELLKHFSFETK